MHHPEMISQLQQTLRSPESVDQVAVRRAAEAYASLCGELVEVIDLAAFFLERGFRAEALRICDRDPDVFTQFAALDFPERPRWLMAARNLGIHTPDFPTGKLKRLNDAYDYMRRVEFLAKNLRILNRLSRPAEERVALLNMLIKREPYNMVWQENLAEIERSSLP